MLRGTVGKICFSRLLEGEDLLDAIKKRVEESGIRAGAFLSIGALKEAEFGCYKARQYEYLHFDGPLEIVSCSGTIAVDEQDEVLIHAHVVVSNEKGEASGGHLMKNSIVGVTAELVVIEAVGVTLQKIYDEKTNLKLLKLG